ncbi:MAG: AAA family ATPase [Archangium sp.]|nr:AAA family ATPase [Archangium sp.]
MKLSFKCLVVTHTSGRVTVTPLELPEFAVHGRTLEEARFELTLALDDRIGRSHPRHLWRYCNPGSGELVTLSVPVLPLHGEAAVEKAPLILHALESPAQAGHTEARLLSTELRFWFKAKGAALITAASSLMTEHLKDFSPDALLRLRVEGKAELLDLDVEVTPLRLASLKRSELRLEERPPPKAPDEEPEKTDELDPEDEPPEPTEEDEWDDDRPKKKPAVKPKHKATPTLNRLGVKWHQLAKEGAFPLTFGRDAIVEQVRAHLLSKDPEPLVLLGAAGVGKTAVLQEVARKLVAQGTDAKPARPFFQLDSSRLIAGEGFFGDWQRQTIDAFAEAHEAGALLHLGRLVDLLDAGKSAHSDDNVAQLLLPTLAARDVAVVAEATPQEWARLRDRNQSFARLFAPLTIEEPTAAEGANIIARIAAHEGSKREVVAEAPAVDEVRTLVRRFRPYGSPLGNAVSFLRRLLDGAAHARLPRLTRAEVVRRFSIESGVPEELLRDDLPLDPAEVRGFLGARVMGQPAAVARVAQVVSVIKANLADPLRPVATLLFAGPTGVGKTELSKALAERVFGSKDRMVRLDMGEYAGPDALSRLIGDESTEGYLAAAVRRQPFSVVLLDELEKAHPAVFDALLSVLGEGRLTDGRGRLADFRSTVLVMTSNLGAQTLRARVGFGSGDGPSDEAGLRAHYLAEVRRFFRPELFNRLDEVVVFESLSREHLSTIVQRELKKVSARSGFGRLDVALSPSADVVEKLADWGFEPRYGARPLKRALERRLVVPAAAHLAAHTPTGASRLEVSLEADQLSFVSHSVPRSVDGVSRASLLELCEKAAGLRAEVRAWVRSPLMRQLRDGLRLFERLSRMPSYWEDRSLADEQSRRATGTKTLWESFDQVRAQAEAAEELAFEAYGLRASHSAKDLHQALHTARDAFEPLTERLFASLYPPVNAATLTLVPGRGASHWAHWLVSIYGVWAKKRGLTVELSHLAPKTNEEKKADELERARSAAASRTSAREVERVLQQQGVSAAVKVYRDKTGVGLKEAVDAVHKLKAALENPVVSSHEWKRAAPAINAPWVALALHVHGDAIPMLLSAEHGSHRIHAEGSSFTVKVRFQPGNVKLKELGQPEQLDVSMPNAEIRRIWPTRKGQEHGLLKDLRTGTDHPADADGFVLSHVLAAFVRHRVFGAQESEWI